MKDEISPAHTSCLGFTQETENGGIYELGNGWIHRRLLRLENSVYTTSLVNVVNGEEYVSEFIKEYALKISHEGVQLELGTSDMSFIRASTPVWNDETKQVRFDFSSYVEGKELDISLFYETSKQEDVIRKWLQIGPLENWFLDEVILENMNLVTTAEGVEPKTAAEHLQSRFEYGVESDSVIEYWGCTEGIFALIADGNGSVTYSTEHELTLCQQPEYPLDKGYTTSQALIGAYRGQTEFGFLSYRLAKERELRKLSQIKQIMLKIPDADVESGSTAELRRSIRNSAWKNPLELIDTSGMTTWISKSSSEKRQILHSILSLTGILSERDLELLSGVFHDPEILTAVNSAQSFYKRFGNYLQNYVPILSDPDGSMIDGHGHFIGESGFMVLINPLPEIQTIGIPLEEPGLWLSQKKKYKLSDWSSLSSGIPLDDAKVSSPPQMDLAPFEIRIVGVNIPLNN